MEDAAVEEAVELAADVGWQPAALVGEEGGEVALEQLVEHRALGPAETVAGRGRSPGEPVETIKTRLRRANELLRRMLAAGLGS